MTGPHRHQANKPAGIGVWSDRGVGALFLCLFHAFVVRRPCQRCPHLLGVQHSHCPVSRALSELVSSIERLPWAFATHHAQLPGPCEQLLCLAKPRFRLILQPLPHRLRRRRLPPLRLLRHRPFNPTRVRFLGIPLLPRSLCPGAGRGVARRPSPSDSQPPPPPPSAAAAAPPRRLTMGVAPPRAPWEAVVDMATSRLPPRWSPWRPLSWRWRLRASATRQAARTATIAQPTVRK